MEKHYIWESVFDKSEDFLGESIFVSPIEDDDFLKYLISAST